MEDGTKGTKLLSVATAPVQLFSIFLRHFQKVELERDFLLQKSSTLMSLELNSEIRLCHSDTLRVFLIKHSPPLHG